MFVMSTSHRNDESFRGMGRRSFCKAVAAGGAVVAVSTPSLLKAATPTLVVASQGGSEMQFHKQFVIPYFEKETGATVRYMIGAHPDRLVKLRAEVPKPSFHVYFS